MISVVITAPVDLRSQFHQRLKRVMESPKARTSEIEWTITYMQGRDAGLVERHITRTVGDTVWQVNMGDETGCHWTTYRRSVGGHSEEARRNAEFPKEELAGPRHSLVHDGVVWHVEHQMGQVPLGGFAIPAGEPTIYEPFDFAAPGLRVYWPQLPSNAIGLRDSVLEGFEDAEWSVTSHGNIDLVTAEFDNKLLEWHLDKTKGDQPVYAAFYQGFEMRYASYTELFEVEGRWLPLAISFYERDQDQPYKVVEVQKASFDRPDHFQEVTPEHIGVLFGSQLYCAEGLCSWDGTGLISYTDEYYELLFIHGLRPGPVITELQAGLEGRTAEEQLALWDKITEQWRAKYLKDHGEAPWLLSKTEEPDEWDLYVAEFIKKHKLDEPRIKRANELLERSKKLRDYHKRKNRSKIEKAKREGDEEKQAKYEAITRRIFDKVLVRGLNKLLPDTQQVAASAKTE